MSVYFHTVGFYPEIKKEWTTDMHSKYEGISKTIHWEIKYQKAT